METNPMYFRTEANRGGFGTVFEVRLKPDLKEKRP
jgi:hypothetical protein